MDLKMPIKSGLEATTELRKLGKKMPIIAQTAYAFSEDKEIAISSGCDYYISKPIERNELLGLIDRII
jgi:CheY-like chemotaxis protein